MTETAPLAWPARHIAPRAADLDADPAALQATLDDLAAAGLLGLRAPAPHGLTGTDYARWTIEVARASGTFAFLQVQHQSAVGFLTAAEGPARRWLPALSSGRTRCGISYGWLRRPGPPAVRAEWVSGSLHMRGHIPWFTGHGFFSHSVTAARLPDQRIVLALHPVAGAGVTASTPMPTAVFAAARTVTLDLELVVPADDVLQVVPADWLTLRDPHRVVGQGALILGTAWAALDVLEHAVSSGRARDLAPAVETARHALTALDERFMAALAHPGNDGLALRTACIARAGRLAHAAVAAWSGSSTGPAHPAQRVYREVLGFTVLSQTHAVRDASVAALLALGSAG